MRGSSGNLIFIIEDSADNKTLLSLLLESKGYNVLCASNGQEALSILQELEHLPDLILLDAQMPVMDGYQFRAAQNKIDRLRSIPVVVMTGDSGDELNERMNYPDAILTKPLGMNSLFECVLPYMGV